MANSTTNRWKPGRAALVLSLALTAAASAEPNPAEANRYPYDPVCAWGRIANGRGMLVRCIEKSEADALLARVTAPAAGAPSAAATGASTPAPSPSATNEPEQSLSARLVRVVADEGKLPVAEKKLDLPRDRYVDCVKKNGGLSAERGEVHVRFLVRARGRAEGVSVAKKTGVGAKAAACIADVVDRRAVGTPDVPMVGATAIIEIKKAP